MKVSLLVIGKTKVLKSPIEDYDRRAARYWKWESHDLPIGRGQTAQEVQSKEAEAFRSRFRPGFRRVALTREGKRWSSARLATVLENWAVGAVPGVHFMVGGAFGLSRSLIEECTDTWSLSDLTLPHEVARLILAEQLYRAGTILKNEPYHKGHR